VPESLYSSTSVPSWFGGLEPQEEVVAAGCSLVGADSRPALEIKVANDCECLKLQAGLRQNRKRGDSSGFALASRWLRAGYSLRLRRTPPTPPAPPVIPHPCTLDPPHQSGHRAADQDSFTEEEGVSQRWKVSFTGIEAGWLPIAADTVLKDSPCDGRIRTKV